MATSKSRQAVGTKTRTAERRKPAIKKPSRRKSPGRLSRLFFPGLLSVCFIGGIGFLMLMGYRTVTASEFFNVKSVDIRGVNRTSKDDIAKIVDAQTERTGVWNADLAELRARIEKLTFVKSAAVSRVLPNGIRVNVIEKKPEAIASLSSGNFLIDGDGQIITAVSSSDTDLPVVIKGWDEAKTEKASKENLQRVRLYQKMISQWSQFELVKRVKEVNLSDLQEPKAVIEDSGSSISVSLSKEDVGKSLKSALEAVAGKGNKIRSVNAAGVYPVIEYMGY